jgi:2-dehydropantoate 2-reductase
MKWHLRVPFFIAFIFCNAILSTYLIKLGRIVNITVVGPGAVGSLWAIKLHQAGHNVSVWSRSTQTDYLISLDDQAEVRFNNNNQTKLADSDLILITVKAWQVESAILPLIPHIDKDTILLFMHNGMGAVDRIASHIEPFPVVLATTTQAAYKSSPTQVHHTGHGNTQLGGYNSNGNQCAFLVDVLNHALPDVVWNNNINQALWGKLAVNCAINPLTGLEQVKNGQLAEEKYQALVNDIVAEVVEVMTAENLPTSIESLSSIVQQVIQATAANNSSMKQDMFYQRKTEIDFITGHLLNTARKHGIATPANQALFERVKQQEVLWHK